MRSGIDVLEDVPGDGNAVNRHGWYQIRLRMWLHRGDPVRWRSSWGTSPAELEEEGQILTTYVRIDREQLIAGLFYGCEGMRVGGKRTLRIAPHLAYREQGIAGIIPENALITAELQIVAEGFPE
jgi:FKBP-type peptidyl-prolyl cis-trans isomerase